MSKNEDFDKMMRLQSRALDILDEVMNGFGDPDENRQKLDAVKVFNVMAKQSGFVIAQDSEDAVRVMMAGIDEREKAIEAAEAAANQKIELDEAADRTLRMIRGGR